MKNAALSWIITQKIFSTPTYTNDLPITFKHTAPRRKIPSKKQQCKVSSHQYSRTKTGFPRRVLSLLTKLFHCLIMLGESEVDRQQRLDVENAQAALNDKDNENGAVQPAADPVAAAAAARIRQYTASGH